MRSKYIPRVGRTIATKTALGAPLRLSALERLMKRTAISGGNNCWEWQGQHSSFGHGMILVNKSAMMAHRVAWELAFGVIEDGLCILHKCDNPSCVRPSHLFKGTKGDNARDCADKGRQAWGERNARCIHKKWKVLKARKMRLSGHGILEISKTIRVPWRTVESWIYGLQRKRDK